MYYARKAANFTHAVIDNASGKVLGYAGAGGLLAVDLIGQAMAALPADVDIAIASSQTDVLAMIGKGFAYTGAIVGLMTVLAVFIKIIGKGKRG
jgi:hypothetical protein